MGWSRVVWLTKKLVSKTCKTFRILAWLLLIKFQAYFLTILPRVGFSFGQHQEYRLWPESIYAHWQWRSIFCNRWQLLLFQNSESAKVGRGPRFATSCFGSGQNTCFCCWPKEKPPLRMRLTCWALSYVLNKFLVWIRQGVEVTVFRELKKHIEKHDLRPSGILAFGQWLVQQSWDHMLNARLFCDKQCRSKGRGRGGLCPPPQFFP